MVIHTLHPHMERPEFWATWLGELYTFVYDDGFDGTTFMETLFGSSILASHRFWFETEMENPAGDWPVYSVPIGARFEIKVRQIGTPSYEDRYCFSRCGSLDESILGYGGGHFMLPAFRWSEVTTIAAASGAFSQTVLLLLPGTHLNEDELGSGAVIIHDALIELGFESAALDDFVSRTVQRLHRQIHWFYDREFGWLTKDQYSRRCRDRPQGRLSDDELRVFKEFTDSLNLQPKLPGASERSLRKTP